MSGERRAHVGSAGGQVWMLRYARLTEPRVRRATPESEDLRKRLDEWPFDTSDDPAFYSAARFGGPISWGICRADMRARVAPGDTLIFIAADDDAEKTTYCFSGFLTVAQKISQIDVWRDSRYAIYRDYLNLLVAPTSDDGSTFAHRETQPVAIHGDWENRIAVRDGRDWKSRMHKPSREAELVAEPGTSPSPLRVAANYIIFSTDPQASYLLDQPPAVAEHRRSSELVHEEWLADPVAEALRRLTLDRRVNTKRAGLRSSPTGFEHPPMKIRGSADDWRRDALAVLKDLSARASRWPVRLR